MAKEIIKKLSAARSKRITEQHIKRVEGAQLHAINATMERLQKVHNDRMALMQQRKDALTKKK
jgi:hypothetical protein